MIALAILGMGLLVIGAALPVGLRYTRESVNIATGQAAAEHALDLIAQNVCLARRILGPPDREPGLFQPRDVASGDFDPSYEPVIKVRPFYVRSINATPGSVTFGEESDPAWGASVEQAIYYCLTSLAVTNDTRECDYFGWMYAALASVAQVYPPITPDAPFLQSEFFADKYHARPVLGPGANGAETRKVLDSLISWTAFYRRVFYDDSTTLTVNEGDPTLYEFVAVAVRRPSARSRFPLQDPAIFLFSGDDVPAPVPWLVAFATLPALPAFTTDTTTGQRLLPAGFTPPATLQFLASAVVGALLPVGSVIIPAEDDVCPAGLPGQNSPPTNPPVQWAGFVPSAPGVLPIYYVVDRVTKADGTFVIIVKYNGYYPWTYNNNARNWPVWVIPPAYEEGTSSNPVLPNRSPILAVARRYVRLREIP